VNLYNAVRNSPVSSFDTDGRMMLIEVNMASLLQASLKGALIGGTMNATAKLLFMKGAVDWKGVIKAFGKGATTGLLTGGTGLIAKKFAAAFVATGTQGEVTKMAGLILGGMNAAIGFTAGQAIEGKNMIKTLSTKEGQWGAGIALGLGAALGAGGVWSQENDWTGATLDGALKFAGSVGGATAMNVYEAGESVREFINDYKTRIDEKSR
jgi:hypothetical protein